VREPQYVCIATWMGYEDHGKNDKPMRDIYGVHGLVFGGTLPAKIFARTFEILREIQADRKARLAGKPTPSPTPSARKRRRSTQTSTPRVTRRPSPTAQPAQSPKPVPSPSPPPILPSTGPEPSQGAGPGPPG
jgi:membrane peptidoglycan carboxypeptidase